MGWAIRLTLSLRRMAEARARYGPCATPEVLGIELTITPKIH